MHLVAPGWNVIGGGEPPFAGVDAGSNERMAWGFTFAGTDMVDVYVEELHPDDPNLVRWRDGWEPLRIIEEEIPVKGREPEPVVLKFSRHGPVFLRGRENGVAYAVRSVVQEPGTAAYKGSFPACPGGELRRLLRAGDALAGPDPQPHLRRRGRQHRAPGDRADAGPRRLERPPAGARQRRLRVARLPRGPAAGVQSRARLHRHRQQQRAPARLRGAAGLLPHVARVETSRIARLHQILGAGEVLSVDDHKRIQHDARLLAAERNIPRFQGWSSEDADVEWARGLIADWDGTVSRESTAGALYVRWRALVDGAVRDPATSETERRAIIEQGLAAAIERLTEELGPDRAAWRHGRVHASELPHMLVPAFDLPPVERPGGFGAVNATGANFRRIIDLADPDRSVASNAPAVGPAREPLLRQPGREPGQRRVLPAALHPRSGGAAGGAPADAAAGW